MMNAARSRRLKLCCFWVVFSILGLGSSVSVSVFQDWWQLSKTSCLFNRAAPAIGLELFELAAVQSGAYVVGARTKNNHHCCFFSETPGQLRGFSIHARNCAVGGTMLTMLRGPPLACYGFQSRSKPRRKFVAHYTSDLT